MSILHHGIAYRAQTSLNLQVGDSADDALQLYGSFAPNLITVTFSVYYTSTSIWGGLRFSGVAIPPGATIQSAYLSIYVSTTGLDSPYLKIYGEDSDNPGQFTTATNNLCGRTLTTANTEWHATNIGTGWKQSPDISSVIQEIVDRGGWASGNSLVLLLVPDYSATAEGLRIVTYEGLPENSAAKLDIEYTG